MGKRESSDPRIMTNSLMLAMISAGVVKGFAGMQKYGQLPSTRKNTWEDVWIFGGTYTFQAAPVRLGVSSANMVDEGGDDGAWTVEIAGLDEDYVELTETVTLTGQDKVETDAAFLRVNRAKVLASGSLERNAGRLYVYDATDSLDEGVPQTASKILAVIEAECGQTQQAIYTIPAQYRGFLLARHVEFSARISQYVDVEIAVRPHGGSWLRKSLDPLAAMGTSEVGRPYFIPMKDDLEGRTDIRSRAIASMIGLNVVVVLQPCKHKKWGSSIN